MVKSPLTRQLERITFGMTQPVYPLFSDHISKFSETYLGIGSLAMFYTESP